VSEVGWPGSFGGPEQIAVDCTRHRAIWRAVTPRFFFFFGTGRVH